MANARQLSEWDRTAHTATAIHNANCTDRFKLITDTTVFNPIRQAIYKMRVPRISIAEAARMSRGARG